MANQEQPPASSPVPKKGRCPRCGKSFDYISVSQHKVFPFCSQRCRDVDLGNWITGKYRIEGPAQPQSAADVPSAEDIEGT